MILVKTNKKSKVGNNVAHYYILIKAQYHKFALVYDKNITLYKTADDVVTAIKLCARFLDDQTNDEYMLGFAQREQIYSGKILRTENAEVFVEDLINQGISI
jgi:hypothetical protein